MQYSESSSRAHMSNFHTLLCKTASVQQNLPNVWIAADCLARSGGPTAGKENERAAAAQINRSGRPTRASTTTSSITTGSGAGSNVGHVVSSDARECLKEVGRELCVPR